jgi:hypothetical protein
MLKRIPAAGALLWVWTIAAAPAQTVSVDSTNPHYYSYQGKPTLLITSAEHYGGVVNLDFDYVKYFDALQAYGLNYTRIYPGYLFEPMGKFLPGNTLGVKPSRLILPWARSTVPGYLLSGNKFDLDRWDPQYFARLKDFIAQAGKRGIVVEICFFNAQYSDTWPLSPLYFENNIQGVGKVDFRDAETLKDPVLIERESAYIRKIVQEVNAFDNVILEVCDEPSLFTPIEEAGPWVGHMLEVTYAAEAGLQKKHLVAQQVQGTIDGPIDFSGSSLVSTIVTQYLWLTGDLEIGGLQALDREYRHNKPIEQNETNYYPLYRGDTVGASRVEAWEFMVGGGAGFNQLNGLFTPDDPAGNTPQNARLLGGLRSLKTFLESFRFVSMVPDRGFVVSGFEPYTHYRGLSEYGKQYALYIHHSEGGDGAAYVVKPGQYHESLVLSLPPGKYNAEWIDPASSATIAATHFEQTAPTRLLETPTYAIDIALRIKRE